MKIVVPSPVVVLEQQKMTSAAWFVIRSTAPNQQVTAVPAWLLSAIGS